MKSTESSVPSRRYANYVLFVLVLVYVFNFVDRQVLSILAEDIKADLGHNINLKYFEIQSK